MVLQLGARVIDHLARRVDLLPRLRDLALERGGAAARLIEQRKRAGDPADGGRASLRPNRETPPAPAGAAASSARPSTARMFEICGRSLVARSGNAPFLAM